MLNRFRSVLFVLCLWPLAFAQAADNSNHEQRVHDYIAAFNARDVDAMMSIVTDDVQWLTVSGTTVVTETNSKAQLRQGMASYFNSCTTCKSSLEHVFSTEGRVSALEVARYETANGPQAQRSVSVYEFSGNLIKRVYYFAAEQ